MEALPRSNAQTVSFEAGSGLFFRTSSFISTFPDGRLFGDATPVAQQQQGGKTEILKVRAGLAMETEI
jgi:hypothetical protein